MADSCAGGVADVLLLGYGVKDHLDGIFCATVVSEDYALLVGDGMLYAVVVGEDVLRLREVLELGKMASRLS